MSWRDVAITTIFRFLPEEEDRDEVLCAAKLKSRIAHRRQLLNASRRFWYMPNDDWEMPPAFVSDPRRPERSNPRLNRRASDPHAVVSKELVKLGVTLMAWGFAGQVAVVVATNVYAVAQHTYNSQIAWSALGLLVGYFIGAAAFIPSTVWMRLKRMQLAFVTG